MKAKENVNFENGERVYITEKCPNSVMLNAKELYYVGLSKRGGHVLETEKGAVATCVPGSWFRKAREVTYYVNIHVRNELNALVYSSPYPTRADALKNAAVDGFRFVKVIPVELEM
jgi:hypothetical protein